VFFEKALHMSQDLPSREVDPDDSTTFEDEEGPNIEPEELFMHRDNDLSEDDGADPRSLDEDNDNVSDSKYDSDDSKPRYFSDPISKKKPKKGRATSQDNHGPIDADFIRRSVEGTPSKRGRGRGRGLSSSRGRGSNQASRGRGRGKRRFNSDEAEEASEEEDSDSPSESAADVLDSKQGSILSPYPTPVRIGPLWSTNVTSDFSNPRALGASASLEFDYLERQKREEDNNPNSMFDEMNQLIDRAANYNPHNVCLDLETMYNKHVRGPDDPAWKANTIKETVFGRKLPLDAQTKMLMDSTFYLTFLELEKGVIITPEGDKIPTTAAKKALSEGISNFTKLIRFRKQ